MTNLAASHPAPGTRARALLLVFLAGVLYASAGLFTRALPFDAWTLVAWRSLSGGLFTVAGYAVQSGRFSWRDYQMSAAHWVLVPIGAVATIAYVVALKITTVADVMIVYATLPFVVALVGWLWNGEVPRRRLLVASAVALLGVVVMIGGAASTPGRVAGAVLVMAMNVGFALFLVLARRHPGRSMAPTNALSMLAASAAGFAMAPTAPIGTGPLLLMLLFGIVTVGFAMQLYMAGARGAPSAEVALIGIADVVLGPLMVFAVFGENPGRAAIAGGAIVTGALLWNVWPDALRALRS